MNLPRGLGEGPRRGAQSLEEPRLETPAEEQPAWPTESHIFLGQGKDLMGFPKMHVLAKDRGNGLHCIVPAPFVHTWCFSGLRTWPGHGEEQQSWRTASKPWSKLGQQSPSYRLEGALVSNSVSRRTVVPRLRPFCLDPEAHAPEPR